MGETIGIYTDSVNMRTSRLLDMKRHPGYHSAVNRPTLVAALLAAALAPSRAAAQAYGQLCDGANAFCSGPPKIGGEGGGSSDNWKITQADREYWADLQRNQDHALAVMPHPIEEPQGPTPEQMADMVTSREGVADTSDWLAMLVPGNPIPETIIDGVPDDLTRQLHQPIITIVKDSATDGTIKDPITHVDTGTTIIDPIPDQSGLPTVLTVSTKVDSTGTVADLERFRPHADNETRRHILEGDETGGGHRHGAGKGKSEFPADWDDDKIIQAALEIASNPESPMGIQENGNIRIEGEKDGIKVRVIVIGPGSADYGRIKTAHRIDRFSLNQP